MAQQTTMSPADFLKQPDVQQTPQTPAPKVQAGNVMSVSDWNKLPSPQAQGPQAPPKWVPQDNDSVAEIQTSDGQPFLIHGEDLAEAQRRDKNLKVLSQPQAYRDYARGRTLDNMTRAISGQPMARPEDQAEAERGKRAGTIAGGVQIATGALGGLFTPGVQVAQETSSILGPEGQPVVKEVLKKGPSAIGGVVNAVKDALPSEATMEQAMKVARIVYHLGLGTGGAAFLWHELFGK